LQVREEKKNLFLFFDRAPQLFIANNIITSEEEIQKFIFVFQPSAVISRFLSEVKGS